MAYLSTATAPERRNLTGKNRVWDFFRLSNETRPAKRRQPAQPRRKIRPTAMKPVSGIPYWPSRDPLGDEMFFRGYVRHETENLTESARAKIIKDLRDKSYGNPYLFVDNMPSNAYDRRGLDRQLMGGVHMEVRIDDWKVVDGKYVKDGSTVWGFGRAVTGKEGKTMGILKGVCCFVYQPGVVYGKREKDEPVNEKPPLKVTESTPCDDLRARKRLDGLEADPMGYNLFVQNCRTFARGFLAFGMDGFGGMQQDPCQNPDGTPWKR